MTCVEKVGNSKNRGRGLGDDLLHALLLAAHFAYKLSVLSLRVRLKRLARVAAHHNVFRHRLL